MTRFGCCLCVLTLMRAILPTPVCADEPRPLVRLNEVMFDPKGADAGQEWIELYNSGRAELSLKGWTIANRNGQPIATLPDKKLPPRGFLVVRLGRGQNDDDWADGRGVFHAGNTTEVLNNSQEEIGLYRGQPSAETIVDFVAYALDEKLRPATAHQHAVRAKIWPEGTTFDNGEFVSEGNTIGRDAIATDHNHPSDWYGHGGLHGHGPSPGAANKGPLSYELDARSSAWLLPVLFGKVTDQQLADANAKLNKAIAQIREKQWDLVEPNGDPGLGKGAPQEQKKNDKNGKKGDVVVGNVRFRFEETLDLVKPGEEGQPLGGVTNEPKSPNDEILIQISLKALDDGEGKVSLWRLKDVVLHELIHAAHFRDTHSGLWKTSGKTEPQDGDKRIEAHKVDEALAYLGNLDLLRRLMDEPEFKTPAIRKEMEDRIQFKVGVLIRKYLTTTNTKNAFDVIEDAIGQQATDYGNHLREQLLKQRKNLLRHKVYAFLLESGKLDARDLVELRREIKELNEITPKDEALTEDDLKKIIETETEEYERRKGEKLVEEPQQPPPITPEEKKRLDEVRREHQRLVDNAKSKSDVIKTFEELKITDEATVEAAKKAEEKAKEELKNFEDTHAEDLKKLKIKRVTSLGATEPRRSATLIGQPARVFQTTEGAQAYAALEHFTARGDLSAAVAWAKSVSNHRENLPSSQAGDAPRVIQELQQVESLATLVDRSAKLLVSRARDLREELNQAGGNADAVTKALASAPSAGELVVPDNLAPYINTNDFLGHVLDSFAPDILRQAAQTPQPGVAVTKGGAVLDAASGQPAVATVKITFTETTPDAPADAAPQTKVAKTDETGTFKIELPPGALVRDVQIGGEGLSGGSSENPTDSISVGWPRLDGPRDQWERLTFEERRNVVVSGGFFYDLVRDRLTGSPFLPGGTQGLPDRTPQEIATLYEAASMRHMNTGMQLSEQLLGGSETAQKRLLDLALQKALRNTAGSRIKEALQTQSAAQSAANEELRKQLDEEAAKLPTADPALRAAIAAEAARVNAALEAQRKALEEVVRQRVEDAGQPFASVAEIVVTKVTDSSSTNLFAPRKPLQIVTETVGPAGDQAQSTLYDTLQQTLSKAVDAGQTLSLEAGDVTVLNLPVASGGTSIVSTWNVTVRGANGTPATPNLSQLAQLLNDLPKSNPNIRFTELAQPRTAEATPPNDPHFAARGAWKQEYHDQWALRRIGFDDSDDATSEKSLSAGKPTIVAVIGSGVDWTHPELLGQMWINIEEDPYNGVDDDGNGYIDDQFGWNFRDDNNDVMDYGGHDTHVAGVIASRWNNRRGIIGVNPHARIMALKTANYLGQSNSIDIARAICYAVDRGARVINISYTGESPTRIEQRAIDYALANNVLVVAAAGNQAVNMQQRGLAGARGVLTVTGTTTTNTRAPFSNFGQPIALSAPAMDVLSLRARGTDFLLYVGENPNYVSETGVVGPQRDLYRASGTSFAAPLVSGAASFLFSQRPALTARQVQNMLLMSADDLDVPGWDQNTGVGLLNVRKALQANPDHFLVARIFQIRPIRRDGQVVLEVIGQAEGSSLNGRWLQIAFGRDPKTDDWVTIDYHKTPLAEGVLSLVPSSRFNRRGTWSIRLLIQDEQKTVRQARATLEVE